MTNGFRVVPEQLDQAAAETDAAMAAYPDTELMGLRTDADAIGDADLASTVSDFVYRWQLGVGFLLEDGYTMAEGLRRSSDNYQVTEHQLRNVFGRD